MQHRSQPTRFAFLSRRRGTHAALPTHSPRRGRAKRGVAILALLATPVAVVQLAPLAASASGTGIDTIQFTQTSGSSKAYFKYIPGDGSTATTQNVTGGGGCSNPTIGKAITGTKQGTNDPILGWAAKDWASQTSYVTGGDTAAIVGAYNGETGVCAEAANFSIDNVAQPSSGNSHWGLEALDFSPGTNAVEGANRVFTRATINIANNTSNSTTVHLVETLTGQGVVGIQDCTVGPTTKSNSPAVVAADTKPGATAACSSIKDPTFTTFDNVEIQVPTAGESVSVVQTSTFYLGGGKVCGGTPQTQADTSGSSGGVSATIALVNSSDGSAAPSTVCKSYNNFAVTTSYPDPNDPKAVIFSGTGGNLPSGIVISTKVDWGTVPYCTPDGTPDSSGTPTTSVCSPTLIDFNDGTDPQPQTYCSAPPGPTGASWCTTSRNYSYVSGGSVTLTHITETWAGKGDPTFKFS